ncbi:MULTISPECIES: hypothetical protein [spotted fever group]|uniref:Cell surface antigen-like Sca10 domain protein n=1 Tax=Rickettsia rhipicephali str. Ect TaxID=1359199 RepID=A0A0F3PF50_RICRH|nr:MULTISPECIES: hypothetical protein [spotted fever group]KJV78541.1 cell surface antigen-like Sca10 domain protein [Rickettsia rhipicephali str. Ect]
MIAVAAGDEANPIITKKGLWVAGTFGSSNQDVYKGNPSYKGTRYPAARSAVSFTSGKIVLSVSHIAV